MLMFGGESFGRYKSEQAILKCVDVLDLGIGVHVEKGPLGSQQCEYLSRESLPSLCSTRSYSLLAESADSRVIDIR